jgi:hypothetical protein
MYYSIKWTKLGLGNFLSLEIRAVSKNFTFDLIEYILYLFDRQRTQLSSIKFSKFY